MSRSGWTHLGLKFYFLEAWNVGMDTNQGFLGVPLPQTLHGWMRVWSGRVPAQAHGGGVMEHNGMYYWYGEDKNGETFKPWSIMCALLEHFGCFISPNLSQSPCARVSSLPPRACSLSSTLL